MKSIKQKFINALIAWKYGLIINYHESCPCLHTTPCNPRCTCVCRPSSRGCSRCCSYGSKEQQRKMAEYLVKKLEGKSNE